MKKRDIKANKKQALKEAKEIVLIENKPVNTVIYNSLKPSTENKSYILKDIGKLTLICSE